MPRMGAHRTCRNWNGTTPPPNCGSVACLARPFTRRVERLLPSDTAADLRMRGIDYLLVDDWFMELAGWNLAQTTERFDAEVIRTYPFSNGFGRPPVNLYLLHRRPP